MAKKFSELSDKLIAFIERQHMFFVATAVADGRINVSPKGMDSLRVLDKNRVVWLNVTGSGNETSAHVQQDPRMTLMFAAFEGTPMILRLYGKARVIHKNDPEWSALYPLFAALPGERQVFDMAVELVQTSCGMGVPVYHFVEQRQQLKNWAENKGETGLISFWEENNQHSLDGKATHIMSKNT